MKKTLDIWELNGVFTKETVDYIRQSFLKEDYATSSGNYGQNKQPTQHPNHVDSVQSTKGAYSFSFCEQKSRAFAKVWEIKEKETRRMMGGKCL